MQVGEDVGVRFVAMLGYEFAVNADVEFAVAAGDEGEGLDAVADAVEGVAGHPGGAEGVASIVAVFDLDGVFFRVGHGDAPLGDYSFVESEGGLGYSIPFVLALGMTRL